MDQNKKNKGGRPTKYSEEVANKICDLIAVSNRGLASICKENPDLPKRSTIHEWLAENQQFADKYARAREDQAEFLAEEILEIADDSTRDTIKIQKGDKVVDVENTEWTNRSKLRVEARKWIAAKLKPKKYGDRVTTEHTGEVKVTQITGMQIK